MTENEIKEYIADLRNKADVLRKSGFATNGVSNHFDKSADVIEELLSYRAIGTIEEIKDLKEKNEKQLEAIKLLTIAAICYEKNLGIIRKEMKENKELVTLYCKLPTVQYIKNTIALSKLADSDIDVNNIESIDEIIRIFDWQ